MISRGVGVYNISKLVRHDQFLTAIFGGYDIEQESAAVGVRSPSSVPVLIGAAPEPLVL